MTSPNPVPPELRSAPFPIAVGGALGLGRQRLAGPSFQRPFAGVRIATGLEVEHWRGYVPLLRPGQRFSHVTAVVIRGGPVPSTLAGEVHISTQGRVRVRRPGVIGHNHLRPDEARYDDLPISGPVATFAECARQLTLPDLVAVGDFLVQTPRFVREAEHRPFTSIEDLVSGLQQLRGPSVRLAQRAARLVRSGVESAPETHLRLLVIGDGLPEPETGIEVHREDGRWIGWFDLGWRARRVLLEYDGDQHRTSKQQYERDIRRFDEATAAGWTVVRVRSTGLYQQPRETLTRVRRALYAR